MLFALIFWSDKKARLGILGQLAWKYCTSIFDSYLSVFHRHNSWISNFFKYKKVKKIKIKNSRFYFTVADKFVTAIVDN